MFECSPIPILGVNSIPKLKKKLSTRFVCFVDSTALLSFKTAERGEGSSVFIQGRYMSLGVEEPQSKLCMSGNSHSSQTTWRTLSSPRWPRSARNSMLTQQGRWAESHSRTFGRGYVFSSPYGPSSLELRSRVIHWCFVPETLCWEPCITVHMALFTIDRRRVNQAQNSTLCATAFVMCVT